MRLSLQTNRLTLRRPEETDAEAIFAIHGDLDVARTSGSLPHPSTLECARGWIAIARAQTHARRRYTFVMDEPRDGVVGEISVFKRKPENDWEVGYSVAKAFRRRGFAREALTAVLDWTLNDLLTPRMIAGYFEDNHASGRLLADAGFTPTGETCEVYSMARGAHVRCINLVRDLNAESPQTQ